MLAIVVDEERNKYLPNGLVDLNRDILMKLIRIVEDGKKTQNIIGITQLFYSWSKLPIFRWATQNLYDKKPLPDSVFCGREGHTPKFKCVVVGSDAVGKTCLCRACTHPFCENHIATVFDNYENTIDVQGHPVCLYLWDTAGGTRYDHLRGLSFPDTDAFLVCFAVNDRASFERVESKWMSEIAPYTKDTPAILVGTKSDLCTDARGKGKGLCIAYAEGAALARKLRLKKYVECSAKKALGIDAVLYTAARAALLKPRARKPSPSKSKCVCL